MKRKFLCSVVCLVALVSARTARSQEGALNPAAPLRLAVDAQGNLLVAYAAQIRRMGSNGSFTTIAGTTCGFAGDGGPANLANFCQVSGLATDRAGNVYIAELNKGRIRKIDSAGIISTVAGSGIAGFGGDGGPAIQAQIVPSGIAVDGKGNLYIAESNNNRVRMVNASGIVTTVAGSGPVNGDRAERPIFAGDGGSATAARLNRPGGVAIDLEGNLLIADEGNNRVRKVHISTGVISTFAGNGGTYSRTTTEPIGDGGKATAAYVMPSDVAVDSTGNVLIVERSTGRVRKVTSSGIITTIAGSPGTKEMEGRGGLRSFGGDGGPATAALLGGPQSAVLDSQGNLFIADTYNIRIRKVTAAGLISSVPDSEGPPMR
jgi:hypothetical protein